MQAENYDVLYLIFAQYSQSTEETVKFAQRIESFGKKRRIKQVHR